jgi:tetratricopeptide (TPR) repeat protein
MLSNKEATSDNKTKKKTKKKDLEITFYENLLKERPNFVQALASLGDAYTRKGFYREGLEVDKALAKLKPEDPTVHYNFACSLSLVGELEQAVKELKKAVLFGYDDFSYILEDPDLENVRKLPQFKDFFSKIKRLKV